MSKLVGIVSDIHGNLPALESVLEDMPSVDEVWCAGDVIGYNPWPRECVEQVRVHCCEVVRGNHDRHIQDPDHYKENSMARAGLQFADSRLTDEQKQWLTGLPDKMELSDGSVLCHSHPEFRDAYVYPSEVPNLDRVVDGEPVLIMGHTHVPVVETVKAAASGVETLVVNPGSVGQPRDGDQRGSYAVLEFSGEAVSAEICRVSYDVDRVVERIGEVDLPSRSADRLKSGR